MTSYFCETSETAILTKTRKKRRTTLSAIANRTKIEIKNDNELQNSRGRSELQLLCCYNSCKAVANNGEGSETAFRNRRKSRLTSLI